MKHILSIDHGGSKTRAIVCNDCGHVVYACDDISMYRQKPRDCFTWQEHIERLMGKVNDTVGFQQYRVVVVSTNGVNSKSELHNAQSELRKRLKTTGLYVAGDCIAALRGCELSSIPNGISIVLCAGSGLNCAISIDGREIRTLGWRINACDQGGYALGRRIWQSAVDDFNGLGGRTLLSELLLSHYHRKSVGRLITDVSTGRLRFSPEELSPLLFTAISLGDSIALNIVSELAERWLGYVHLMLRESGVANGSHIRVFTSGGLFRDSANTFGKVLENLSSKSSFHLEIKKAEFPPIGGATLLALDKLHCKSLPAAQFEFQHTFKNIKRAFY